MGKEGIPVPGKCKPSFGRWLLSLRSQNKLLGWMDFILHAALQQILVTSVSINLPRHKHSALWVTHYISTGICSWHWQQLYLHLKNKTLLKIIKLEFSQDIIFSKIPFFETKFIWMYVSMSSLCVEQFSRKKDTEQTSEVRASVWDWCQSRSIFRTNSLDSVPLICWSVSVKHIKKSLAWKRLQMCLIWYGNKCTFWAY